MKTEPMSHQLEGQARLDAAPEYFALGAEQGTGKTWMLLNDAERQYEAGRINALLVVAPKGVHANWILREIPTHLSVRCESGYWVSGGGVRKMRALEKLLRPHDEDDEPRLTILTINIDALNTKNGEKFAARFLRRYRTYMAVDESHLIKNPSSKRSKKVVSLGTLAVTRRIASGTLIANSPLDLFGQYDFLRSGLLGTTSFRTFTAEYAELLPPDSKLVADIRAKNPHSNPQVIRRDRKGNAVYRNLDKLKVKIQPHTFRVLKSECLDLPEKIYQTHYFQLSPAHRKFYDRLEKTMRHEREDGEVDIYQSMTLITKLRQVASGYILEDGAAVELSEPDAGLLKEADTRMDALLDVVELIPEGTSIIVWASYREELRRIAEVLQDRGVVEYHGGTKDKARDAAIDDFQSGAAKTFVSNPSAGGTGLTLTAAEWVIYYSCSYSLVERQQSEDRAHRIGTKKNVVYVDLAAIGTIDERIAGALQAKSANASEVLDGWSS